jgi:hypothetical protein
MNNFFNDLFKLVEEKSCAIWELFLLIVVGLFIIFFTVIIYIVFKHGTSLVLESSIDSKRLELIEQQIQLIEHKVNSKENHYKR